MTNPQVLLTFLWQLCQYGGLVIAGFSLWRAIKAYNDHDADKVSNSIFYMLAGIFAFIFGMFMMSQTFPTLG